MGRTKIHRYMNDQFLESCLKGGVFQILGSVYSDLAFFQNLAKMSLKGYILDSNGLISLKLSVAMGKWMISVKNSKNSLIFANFGCFCMFRVKKTTFPSSEMAQEGQFSGSHPYGLQL